MQESVTDGEHKAVVDNVEDEKARVFIEDDEEDDFYLIVDAETLPDEGCHQDAIFDISVQDGDMVEWNYQPEETKERRRKAQDRFDRLSE